jgi:hypothetical protein
MTDVRPVTGDPLATPAGCLTTARIFTAPSIATSTDTTKGIP